MNYLVEIQKHFEPYVDEEIAVTMAAYMKNNFRFLGIKSPLRNALLKEFLAKHGNPNIENLSDIIIGLWSLPQREYQYCAMELAKKALTNPLPEDILTITYMLEYKQWWDTVDFIASNLVGHIFNKLPRVREDYFDKWVQSNDMWLNRTAILFQLKYKEKTDPTLLKKAIIPHLNSKEFFHQKAIGWALRQYSKTHPDWVSHFVNSHTLSKLSKREASKYL